MAVGMIEVPSGVITEFTGTVIQEGEPYLGVKPTESGDLRLFCLIFRPGMQAGAISVKLKSGTETKVVGLKGENRIYAIVKVSPEGRLTWQRILGHLNKKEDN